MPPRHGKSELTSYWFPVWFLSLFPQKRVMLCSYEADFAASWGRRVRDTIVEHSQALRIQILAQSSAANRWHLTAGGSMMTAGVRGPITGKGGDLVIVDDPVKNFEEAYSPAIRQHTWEWYTSTLRTRLEPGAVIVVVMTRWHEDDLAGRLLDQETGWRHIMLPAVSESEDDPLGRAQGEALWPERYDEDALAELETDVGELVWAGLFQQRPAALEGGMFKRKWFRYWYPMTATVPPPVLVKMTDGSVHTCEQRAIPKAFDEHCASWDLPFKGKKESDMVAGQVWSRAGADCYLIDECRDRMDFPAQLKAVENLTLKHPDARRKLVEDAANGAALVSTLREKIPGIIAVPPKGSKEARAAAVSSSFESGNVYVPHPRFCGWTNAYVEELVSFPGARYDDRVDATSQALVRLSNSALARLRRLATM